MNQQPLSRDCFVCGVENPVGLRMCFLETAPEPGAAGETGSVQVTAEYTVPAHYQGYPGVVHGGIIATMLDEVTSRTVFRGDPPRFVVTAKLSVRYRKPVLVEIPLRLTGRVVEDKGRVIAVAGEIFGPGDVLLAEAEAVLVEVDASFFGDGSQTNGALSPQNWRVMPPGPADPGSDQGGG